VIAIDELDKLSEASDLVEVINDMKDLFHIEGVHFLVSVSTDALDNFASRGVPTRDAFDSAFDTIFSMNRMLPEESIRILQARSTGFPVPLALFCHAWVGGLPRDLLRTARSCVETYRTLGVGERRTDVIAREVALTSASAAVSSLIRHFPLQESVAPADRSAILGIAALTAECRYLDASCALAEARGRFLASAHEATYPIHRYLYAVSEIVETYCAQPVPVGEWGVVQGSEQLNRSQQLASLMASVSDPGMPIPSDIQARGCGDCLPSVSNVGVPCRRRNRSAGAAHVTIDRQTTEDATI
jgi:hypothetical protein